MQDPELEALLARCASEPIHAPGAIQPHGALLVLDDHRRVVAASANLHALTGLDLADVLGTSANDGIGEPWATTIATALDQGRAEVELDAGHLECTAARSGEHAVVELEVEPPAADDGERLHQILERFLAAPSIDELAEQVVAAVAELTGFDRVMCYRFDPEWNGEVIAEQVATGVESFDGLRFPASDIPPPARAQYERTPLRLIPDADAEPVALVTLEGLARHDLDLSDAKLRAVSPVHLRYLRNLGVRSSMSVSLTVDGRLWGIVACHHVRGPLCPPRRVRRAIELVARTTSLLLTVLESNRSTSMRLGMLERIDELSAALLHVDDLPPTAALAQAADAVLDLVGATGAVLVGGDGRRALGTCPPDEVTTALLARCRAEGAPVATDELRSLDPDWGSRPDVADVAAGALAVPVGPTGDRGIVWYRPQEIRTVRWAGDPAAKEIDDDRSGGGRLGPRTSFAAYAEVVQGRSAPWLAQEVDAAEDLADRLAEAEAIQAEREAKLAAHLQQTLLLESFPAITGVFGAAEYRPVSNSPLGGDWYDVFYLPSGRSIVALGDVAGHGLEVAGIMAQLRHALRAYLVRAPSTNVALERLNHLTWNLLPTELATVVLVEIDLDHEVLRIANAGHLPPLIVGPDGHRFAADVGPALGVQRGAGYELTEVPVRGGERLVLYSDGLIERRSRTIDASLDELAAAATATLAHPVPAQCEALAELLTVGSDIDDDVTVVVAEVLAAAS